MDSLHWMEPGCGQCGQGSLRVRLRWYLADPQSGSGPQIASRWGTEEVSQPTGHWETWEGPGKSSGPRDQKGGHILSKALTPDWLWSSPLHKRLEKNWAQKSSVTFLDFQIQWVKASGSTSLMHLRRQSLFPPGEKICVQMIP